MTVNQRFYLPAKVNGRHVRIDEEGRVCLNDLHRASRYSKNRRPCDWCRLAVANQLVQEVLRRITGKSRNYANSEIKSVLCTKRGANGGTYAHSVLALSYAEYLSPKLAYEVREIYLRFKSGDPNLADEILERASAEENHRVAVRAMGRAVRNEHTDALDAHGVKGGGFAECTNELYRKLFDGTAAQLRTKMLLPPGTNLREHMSAADLAYVMAGEALSTERICEENSHGSRECKWATGRSAQYIRNAIEADRRDRREPSMI